MTRGAGIVARLVLVAIRVCALCVPSFAAATALSTAGAPSLLHAPQETYVYDAVPVATTHLANLRRLTLEGTPSARTSPGSTTSSFSLSRAAKAGDAARKSFIASDGTEIVGFAKHGINRAIGDGAKRAGVRPEALLDAIKNATKISEGVDDLGWPFKVYRGTDARVVINPETGRIVSVNPRSGAGANR